jgi:hypothetical protein
MVSVTIPRVAAAGAVLAALALVQLARGPLDGTAVVDTDVVPASAREAPAATPHEEAPAALGETPAAAKQRELEGMSETFRNTTFLIAIRNAGFGCNELLRVVGGLDGSTKWLATCSEMLAYTLGVATDGTLRVAPMMQYFDGVQGIQQIEQQIEQRFEPSNELVLPPQPLPPPR